MVTLGSGDFRYEEDLMWARLPEEMNFLEVPDVVVGPEDRVYAFSRGYNKMIVFDREGNVVDSWGESIFERPHGVTLSHDGNLWCVDDGDHTIRKCTLDGRVLMTLGSPGEPSEEGSGEPFNRPTKVAEEPGTHNLFISDGYGNARVHKFSPEGEPLLSWGDYGTGPGEFNLVHMVVTDPEGLVYVADRENHRVQIFDGEGNYLREWRHHLHRPCGIFISDEPLVYIAQLGPTVPVNRNYPNLGARISIHDLSGEQLAWLGGDHPGLQPGHFIAPHSVAVDSRGDLYVGEVSWADYGRSQTPPREVRSFRKLVKVS